MLRTTTGAAQSDVSAIGAMIPEFNMSFNFCLTSGRSAKAIDRSPVTYYGKKSSFSWIVIAGPSMHCKPRDWSKTSSKAFAIVERVLAINSGVGCSGNGSGKSVAPVYLNGVMSGLDSAPIHVCFSTGKESGYSECIMSIILL